jgi:hypothetical protein
MPERSLHNALAAALLAGSLLMTTNSSAERAPIQVDIAAMQPGLKPIGFSFGLTGQGDIGEWRVVSDLTATHEKAIAQTSSETTDYRFPLAIFDAVSARDLDVMVRFKSVGGKVDQAGGLVVRLTSADNYYVVRANALEDNIRFYRVVDGRRQQIGGVNKKVSGNQWHTLGLRAEGDHFTISFDGIEAFSAQDNTFNTAGRVALWTKADSVTHFDALTIRLP